MGACGSSAGKEPFGDDLASGRRVAVVTMDVTPTGHGRAPTADSRITCRLASRVCVADDVVARLVRRFRRCCE
jgi:hypothetical protein